jgi:CheY-like chemotaxis protein
MFAQTKREIRVRRESQKEIWPVEADEAQIEQALVNIYVNAWQAMPGGGDLYIETCNVVLDEGRVRPFDGKPGRYVKVSVTDSGIGMDEKTQERIFDPFFTTKEMARGTGLGLSSVYGIVKNHGGVVEVESEEGKGSTFSIFLPASEKEIEERRERLTDEIIEGSETVLLVDDEEMILQVGKEMLEALGYTVIVSEGGKRAVDLFMENQDKIDMVILDMIMPDMGGGEVYDRLKEADPNARVLLSSGYSIDGQAGEILQRGCDGFIQKPFNMEQLCLKVRKVLDKG